MTRKYGGVQRRRLGWALSISIPLIIFSLIPTPVRTEPPPEILDEVPFLSQPQSKERAEIRPAFVIAPEDPTVRFLERHQADLGPNSGPEHLANPSNSSRLRARSQPEAPLQAVEIPILSELQVDKFLLNYQEQVLPHQDSQLVLERMGTSMIDELTYQRYGHRFRDIRVVDEGLTVHLRDGIVVGAFGLVTPKRHLPDNPTLSTKEAQRRATRALLEYLVFQGTAAKGEEKFSSTCELVLRRDMTVRTATSQFYHHCHFSLVDLDGSSYSIWVNDTSGQVEQVMPTVVNFNWVPTTATGESLFNGIVGPFEAEVDTESGIHQLQSSEVIVGQEFPGANPTAPSFISPFTSPNDFFTDPNKPGVSVFWGIQEGLDFLKNEWKVDLVKALGVEQKITAIVEPLIQKGTRYDWKRRRIEFGVASGTHVVHLNVVAHELGHMVHHLIGNADFSQINIPGEYPSLLESFADIIGEVVEDHVLKSLGLGGANWISDSPPLANLPPPPATSPLLTRRSFVNPSGTNSTPPDTHSKPRQPDTYPPNVYWINPATSSWLFNYGKYRNNSVQNRWFYLLAQDDLTNDTNSQGTPYSVQGIGLKTAMHIVASNMLEVLQPGDGYHGARNGSLYMAKKLCGEFSQARVSNHNAWHAVGLYPNNIAGIPFTVPGHQTLGISPWGLELKWQAQAAQSEAETSWDVQISTSSDFPPQTTQSLAVQGTGTEGIYTIGQTKLTLETSTEYFWRIRWAETDLALNCWRPVLKFTTDDNIPTPFYPKGGPIHPWEIDFAFSAVEGATHYDIEVTEDPNVFDDPDPDSNLLAFPRQRISADPNNPDQSTTITVPKKKPELFWRVRAVRVTLPEEFPLPPELIGQWSQPTVFSTKEPEVGLLNPHDGSFWIPWPVTLVWEQLKGAEFHIHSQGINTTISGGPKDELLVDRKENWLNWFSYTEGFWKSENKGWEWWVEATGPYWGSELTPWLAGPRDEAKPSDRWTVYIDGDTTLAQVAVSPSVSCVDWNSPVTWNWPLGQSTGFEETLDNGLKFIRQNDGPAQPPINMNATPDPASGNFELGVWLFHKREGDGEILRAVDKVFAGIDVRPTKPEVTTIYPNANDPTKLDIEWFSELGYQDGWKVKTYHGSTCSGDLELAGTYAFPSNSADGKSYGAVYSGLDPGQYSVKLRSIHKPGCQGSPWSDCFSFTQGGPEAPQLDPPEVLSAFQGALGVMLAVFTKVPQADNYDIVVCQDTPDCSAEPENWTGLAAWQATTDVFIALIGESPHPTFGSFIIPIQETALFHHYFFQVRACAGNSCSKYSDWGEWAEGLTWPF